MALKDELHIGDKMSDQKLNNESTQIELINNQQQDEPFIMVIFGGSGDLAKRKLVPAIYNLLHGNCLQAPFAIMGVSRSMSSVDNFRDSHRESVSKHSRSQPIDDEMLNRLSNSLFCMSGDVYKEETYIDLKEQLEKIDRELGTKGNRIFYFSTPPSVFSTIITNLAKAGLIQKHNPGSDLPWSRIIVEKPFGRDLSSARHLNQTIMEIMNENQVFRIDHYLGKETVQNLLVFRFGNTIFEPLWNRKYVDHVQITALEDIDIQGRGNFYNDTGVFRDVVQNHLLELLSLCAMEAPVTFQADDIRDQKHQLLRSIRPITGASIKTNVVCGQYAGYLNEAGIPAESRTPTFAAMKVMIDNWRWQGTPFYLRAGKAMQSRSTEIAIHYKTIPFCLFGREEVCQMIDPNVLLIRIQPDEGISMRFVCKEPGDSLSIGNVNMNFQYAAGFEKQSAEAYEKLLLDCARGEQTLFARKDSIEKAWELIDPILHSIESDPSLPMSPYEKGSNGPRESAALLAQDNRCWYETK